MNRRHSLITAAALFLLGSTTITALAADNNSVFARQPAPPALVSAPRSVVTSYFAALDNQGRSGHNYRALNGLYASTIVLVESMTSGQPRLHAGPQQVSAFDHWNQASWTILRREQLSPGVVLTIEHPSAKGPGHELDRAAPWVTVFTIRNGKIVNLAWMAESRHWFQ
jgi:hypothetical protein